jgi:hypothetical protein
MEPCQYTKSRLNSANVCYQSLQNPVPYSLLPKNVKTRINYNLSCCFIWVWNLGTQIKGQTRIESLITGYLGDYLDPRGMNWQEAKKKTASWDYGVFTMVKMLSGVLWVVKLLYV